MPIKKKEKRINYIDKMFFLNSNVKRPNMIDKKIIKNDKDKGKKE